MNRLNLWVRDAAWSLGYTAIFYAAFQTAHLFWYLPAGVRFAALLFSPYRRWPWLIAAESLLYIVVLYSPFVGTHGIPGIATLVSNPLLAALGPLWLRSSGWNGHPSSPAAMARLLAASALSAFGALLGNLFFPFSEATQSSNALVFLQIALGDYVGMLAVVPPLIVALSNRPEAATLRRWRVDIPCVLMPMLALYMLLAAHTSETRTFFLSAMLGFLPSLYFAVRSDWRGAAVAVSAATFTVAWSGAMAGNTDSTIEAQGLLAVIGSACLLLGAAQDALRSSRHELSRHNAYLVASAAHQARLATELRNAARRNLNLSEDVRRWITSELHDEIGQNLTALQTRVRLLERRASLEGSELAVEIDETLMRMRQAVSGLMSNLRPAGLDDLGLASALLDGAIRNLVEANGVTYDLRIDDEETLLDRLDDGTQTALYRIVQEAANNIVRHAHATHMRVRLRARRGSGGCHVLLAIDDDGRGFDTKSRAAGIGIVGIRDRVLSLDGRLRLRSGAFGTRVRVRARFSGDGY